MSQNPVDLVTGIVAAALMSLIAVVFLNNLWQSNVAPEPGDPFYGASVAVADGTIIAFGLLGVAGIVGVIAWCVGQAQSI